MKWPVDLSELHVWWAPCWFRLVNARRRSDSAGCEKTFLFISMLNFSHSSWYLTKSLQSHLVFVPVLINGFFSSNFQVLWNLGNIPLLTANRLPRWWPIPNTTKHILHACTSTEGIRLEPILSIYLLIYILGHFFPSLLDVHTTCVYTLD